MKNPHKYMLLTAIILTNAAVNAQELASAFLNEYGKDNSLEVVTIGKKMLGMMIDMNSGEEDLTELQAAIKGLENICIVTSTDTALNAEYYNSCRQMMKNKGFNSIFSSSEDPEDRFVIATKETKGIVKELALLFLDGEGEFSLIQITGNIDLNTLVKYSKNLKEFKNAQ
jgi:hypothetical protein